VSKAPQSSPTPYRRVSDRVLLAILDPRSKILLAAADFPTKYF
jgi:hypothetical protein